MLQPVARQPEVSLTYFRMGLEFAAGGACMTRRIRCALIAALAVAGPLSLAVSGQNYSTAPPLVVTAFGGKPAPAFKAPMTPWGEPDLQGSWSSDDTDGIPMARGGGRAGGNAAAPTGLYRSDEEVAQ